MSQNFMTNPALKQAFVTLAGALILQGVKDAADHVDEGGREIDLNIENETNAKWILHGHYKDCGDDFELPETILPNQTVKARVAKKGGFYGVKGAAIYKKEGTSDGDVKICLYFCNPLTGSNEIGFKHYLDSSETNHHFYCNVPSQESNIAHSYSRVEGGSKVECSYNISSGNQASASWKITSA